MKMTEPREHFLRLGKLLDYEEEEEIRQFRDQFLHLTPDQREKSGKALLRLKLHESHFSPAGHRLMSFKYETGQKLPVFTFQAGDVVSLSRDGLELARYPIGTVFEKDPETVTVAFDWIHEDWLDESGVYHLNRAGNRATYKKMREALHEVREVRHGRLAYLRDVSLGLKAPLHADPLKAEPGFFFNGQLNEWQKKAVLTVLESKDLSVIHGPPGTGKTTVLVEVIRQSVRQGLFVFATAPSNTACDNLLECLCREGVKAVRLGHPARIMESLRAHTLDYLCAHHPFARAIDAHEKEIDMHYRRLDRHKDRRMMDRVDQHELRDRIKALKQEVRQLEDEVLSQVTAQAEVMIGTHTSASDFVLRDRSFDLLVMDEASQAVEPAAWIPLLKAEKAVLAGDHFQLPPTVRSKQAEAEGLGQTLFERLQELLPEDFKALLRVQYRMNESIMNFSSRQFYQGKLIADPSVSRRCLADLQGVQKAPETQEVFVFLDTAGRGFEEKQEPGSESRFNPEEAELVLAEVRKLLSLGVCPADIAVISPYSAQVRLLTSKSPDPRLEIDSVDGFQGREKEAVILSLVRSNMEGEMGFLADTRRMNVAMTRARRKLLVIGDSATLSAISFYQSFIQYSEAVGAYQSSWERAL